MGILAIFDEEEGYAHGLMEYISERETIPFKVVAFSRFEELMEYAKEKEIDMLIVSSTLKKQNMEKVVAKKIITLSDGELVAETDTDAVIYKYQSMDRITKEIINYYAEISRDAGMAPLKYAGTTQIIGVYSPVGRSGKTAFAMTLGQIMANNDPVLYVNMEEFSGLRAVMSKEFQSDLSDLMYYYRQSPASISIKLKAVVNTIHEMDYIPPMVYSGDIRNIKSECWIRMITDIAATGMYGTIILDLSNMVSDVFQILEICDTVYMPLDDDKMALYKINECEEFLLRTEREEILQKTVKIKVPQLSKKNWDENYLEELLWGEMGSFIRKIIKESAA